MNEEVVVVQKEYGMEERGNEMKPMRRRSCHWPMVQPQGRQVLLVAAKVLRRAMLCTSTQRLGALEAACLSNARSHPVCGAGS